MLAIAQLLRPDSTRPWSACLRACGRGDQPMRVPGDTKGSVALMTAVMAPVMIMMLAMGIEVTSWSVAKVEQQRMADASAWVGVMQYGVTNNAQTATLTAADLAEINGASGASSRGWNATTLTTTDGSITAQVVAGAINAGDKAVKVTISRSILKTFSLIFPSIQSSVIVSAVAVAEIVAGPQPCITALGGGADGITTGTDISVTGNANLVANGCSLRSDDGISMSGSGNINAAGVYAGGSISGSGICCALHPNSGQITDPYATYAPVQSALALLVSGVGTAISVQSNHSQAITPGTYSGWDVHGTLTLAPGRYLVNGDISVGAQGTITDFGTGVTIITSGTVNTNGGSSLDLTAPTTTPTGTIPGISGIVIADKSGASMSLLGNSAFLVTGVIYFPNADLKFGGSSHSGSDACTQVVAKTVTLVGNISLAANCSAYGTLAFGSLPGASSVALVQ
jgi:Flp pilus assembly protein TadG